MMPIFILGALGNFHAKLRANYLSKSTGKTSGAPYSLWVDWACRPASTDVVEGTWEPNGTYCHKCSDDSAPRCAD